ncbi:protein Abitram [Bombus impatiens]|uniref:Protein Abitram n=1 Tax=Bombus impatiens TaxID=132113 RepID=A0A6P3UU32_BOMIM|nr:protein Abitram [Bombus impatiens]
MNINSDNNEPVEKRTKSNDIENDSFSVLEDESDTDKHSECQKMMDLIDNEDESILLSNKDDDDDDDSLFPFPPDNDVTDMLEGVKYHGSFPTITDRYFTAYYKLDVQSPADDICILMHSNRICMLTLAPSHAILQDDKHIIKVDFKVSNKLDRVQNKVSGKSKHGAQPLQMNSNICIITCSNEKTYVIKCCIIGKLVEVNEALIQNPKLLLEPPHRAGYLAIVLPNIKLLDKMKKSLLTQEQYDLKMLERRSTTNHLEISEICTSNTLLKNDLKIINKEI